MDEPTKDTENVLLDGCGRVIDYLRISVTDRCNFRCFYCMPGYGVAFIPARHILRYEEMLRIADVLIEMGIRKVRITGGEPLVRKNILFLFRELGKRGALSELVLTTNGAGLAEHAGSLKQAGVNRVNVSLDSLDPKTFERITGLDCHDRVMRGIETSREHGLKVKLNVVTLKGVNDTGFGDFVKFGIDKDVDISFIEVMPQVYNTRIAGDLFIPSDMVREKIQKVYTLTPIHSPGKSSTANQYRVDGSGVTIGFISPLSKPFCSSCNKVRLMPNGWLKMCLFGDRGIDLKTLFEQEKDKEKIKEVIKKAILKKPEKHELDKDKVNLIMHKVGG